MANDPRELDEFKKLNRGDSLSWGLKAFRECILELCSKSTPSLHDLYSSTKIAFEFLRADQEVWNNLEHHIYSSVEKLLISSKAGNQKVANIQYLIRSLILLGTLNPEIKPSSRVALEQFLDNEFKNLHLVAKSEILADLFEK